MRIAENEVMVALFFKAQLFAQLLLGVRREPTDRLEIVRQALEHNKAEQDHRQPFDDEHPLPAAQTANIMEVLENTAGQRPANHPGHRYGDGKQRGYLGPTPGWIPAVEKDQDARKETGLGHAQQKAQHVETGGAVDKEHAGGQGAPNHHQRGDPAPRTDPVQGHVAGHPKQRVGDEEQPCAEAVDRVAELQVGAHLHLREADIDAIQVGKEVTDQQQRHQPPGDGGMGAVVRDGAGSVGGIGCAHDLVLFVRGPMGNARQMDSGGLALEEGVDVVGLEVELFVQLDHLE